jgi:hypothetical protein
MKENALDTYAEFDRTDRLLGIEGCTQRERVLSSSRAKRRELFEVACRLDPEGIGAKRQADPYGAETSWYKAIGGPVCGPV